MLCGLPERLWENIGVLHAKPRSTKASLASDITKPLPQDMKRHEIIFRRKMEEAQLLPYCTRKKKSQGIYVRSYGMYESTVKIVIVEGHVVVVHI
jgi:hypothetical protein